jgi:peroxiredoxin
MTTVAAGELAPALALTGWDGQMYRLEEVRGPVLAVFFKVSCETCRLIFPYLERLFRAYPQGGWHLWGISQDSAADSQAFVEEYDVTFPILLDDGWSASQAYDPEGVPTSFFIGSGGKVIRVVPAFQKAALNELSATIVDHFGAEPVLVIPDDDPAPPFRPG